MLAGAITAAAAATGDVAGWRAARWGMTAAELRRAFPEELAALPARRIYGGAYAELAILDTRFLGVRFDAYFQMNAASGRLQQVLLEAGRGRARPADFAALHGALEDRYGPPTKSCRHPLSKGSPAWAETVWRLPETTVHAVFLDFHSRGMAFEDPNRGRDPLVPSYRTRRNNPRFLPRRLIVRLHPTARADLMGRRCRPDGPG